MSPVNISSAIRPAKAHLDERDAPPLAVVAAVLLRQRHRRAAHLAARDDRHLVDRVGVGLQQVLHDRVAGLVVGGGELSFSSITRLLRARPKRTLSRASSRSSCSMNSLPASVAPEGRLVDDRGEVGAAEPGRGAGEAEQVDVRPELHLAAVDLQDVHAALHVGQRDVHLPVEAAGAGEGGVEHVDAVGAGDDDHLVVRVEAVHLDEDRVERLLALVVPAGAEARAAAAADGVDLVEEDDAGAVVLRLLEQVADPAGADADEHLDEVGAADREERHVGLAGDRLGEQRLAGAGLADEQHAARDAAAEALELLRVLEELDDLHHLVLGLLDAGHVVERDVRVLLAGDLVLGAAEVAEHAAGAGGVAELAEDEEPDEAEDQQPGDEGQEEVDEQAVGVLDVDLGRAALVDHRLPDLVGDDAAVADRGLEVLDRAALGGGERVHELARDLRPVDGHFRDVICVQLVEHVAHRDFAEVLVVAAEQHEQHDGQADEQEPAEHAAPELQPAARAAGPAAAAPAIAVRPRALPARRTLRSLLLI
jgi:hypothetical protein